VWRINARGKTATRQQMKQQTKTRNATIYDLRGKRRHPKQKYLPRRERIIHWLR
jgi:hypothetical protein